MAKVGWIDAIWDIALFPISLILSIVVTVIVLIFVHRKKHWFLIDSARTNPYKLVHRVTKFVCHHKVPIHRSAFTYCEDEIPKGLDLGKTKYGGPFTTEQVEDVKAFYGILKILLTFGIIHFLDIASSSLLTFFARHIVSHTYFDDWPHSSIMGILFDNAVLSSVLIVVAMPAYIFLFLPLVRFCNLTTLQRVGSGMVMLLLSVTCTFVTDAVVHARNVTHICMLDEHYGESWVDSQPISHVVLLPQ